MISTFLTDLFMVELVFPIKHLLSGCSTMEQLWDRRLLFETCFCTDLDLDKPRRISRPSLLNCQRSYVKKIIRFQSFRSRMLSIASTATCVSHLIRPRTRRTSLSPGRGLGGKDHMRIIICMFSQMVEVSSVRPPM